MQLDSTGLGEDWEDETRDAMRDLRQSPYQFHRSTMTKLDESIVNEILPEGFKKKVLASSCMFDKAINKSLIQCTPVL